MPTLGSLKKEDGKFQVSLDYIVREKKEIEDKKEGSEGGRMGERERERERKKRDSP
jgi:hypothetical protein